MEFRAHSMSRPTLYPSMQSQKLPPPPAMGSLQVPLPLHCVSPQGGRLRSATRGRKKGAMEFAMGDLTDGWMDQEVEGGMAGFREWLGRHYL